MSSTQDKITIIGSGAMATASAKVLYQSGFQNICIYGRNARELSDLSQGKNTKHFPTETLLPRFSTSSDIETALLDAKYVVLAIPSIAIKSVFEEVLNSLKTKVLIINLSKGFYSDSDDSLHHGLVLASKNHPHVRGVASLIGPSHAEEMVKEQITFVAAVSEEMAICQEVQGLFSNRYFRTYAQTDVIGAEIGACFKNVLAIISGIMTKKGYGINTKAAILTRGLGEARVFNAFYGGKTATLLGLTCVGDLIATAFSEHSRNFRFGLEFAHLGQKALQTTSTVEGLTALKVIYRISNKNNLDLPLIKNIYRYIFEKSNIQEIIEETFSRPPRAEFSEV